MSIFFKQAITAFVFLLLLAFSLEGQQQDPRSHSVLVSVAPDKFFVEKVAGDTVQVILMVPAGASSHTYEPTPRQILTASKADLWFQLGETFEERASRALQCHNPRLKLVDLRQGLDLITSDPSGHCCCHAHGYDPHIWLSARLAKIQAETIANALSEYYPEHRELYQERLRAFQSELDDLDQEITDTLKGIKNRTIMVSHPAYAYFCRDYDLRQLSVEFEGKDPTPQQLTNILNEARRAEIKTIFIQQQYSSKGARLIAKEIGAEVVTLDPYAENYIESMLNIARNFGK